MLNEQAGDDSGKEKPIVFQMTLESGIINHYFFFIIIIHTASLKQQGDEHGRTTYQKK